MFPNRMSNYLISECTSNFDEADFNLASVGSKVEHKEGTKTRVRYDFNAESGQAKTQRPANLEKLRKCDHPDAASFRRKYFAIFRTSIDLRLAITFDLWLAPCYILQNPERASMSSRNPESGG